MKKLILAPVALAALTASMGAFAQTSSVTLYGQVAAAIEYKDHQGAGAGGNQWSLGNNEFYVSHFGLRGSEDLGGGMKAIFRLESGFNTDTGTNTTATKFWNRQSFVGLDMGQAGTVTLGRQFSAAVDRVVRTLDPYNAGGQGLITTPIALFGVNRFAANGTTYIANDNRTDDAVKYRVSMPSLGLEAGASYGYDDGAGRSYSADVAQTTKEYAIGAAYQKYESPTQLSNGAVPKATTFLIGGNVTFGGTFKVYLSYVDNKLDSATALTGPSTHNKITILGARYTVAPNIDLSATWYGDKGTDLRNPLGNATAGRDGKKNTYIAAVDYYLSKRSLINVAYFRNDLKDGYALDATSATALSGATHAGGIAPFGFSAFSGFMVGIRHAF